MPAALPGTVLRLQNTIGNRVTCALLQRQKETDAPPLLGPSKIARARRFYRSQPRLYTPDILRQIQRAVGAEETGTVTDDLVLGVARFQAGIRGQGATDEEQRLVIDGMAGPRTLPVMFPSGLGSAAAIREYSLDLLGFKSALRDKDAEHRRRLLSIFLGRRFDRLGIPRPTIVLGPDNNFDRKEWTITYREAGLGSIDIDDSGGMRRLAAGSYHEARHCEQSFREAQMLAGEGRSVDEIMTIMSINSRRRDVAEAASRAPTAPGTMDAVIAKGWFESEFGSGRAHREQTLRALAQSDSPAVHHAYEQLPEEFDAFYVAGELADELGGNERGLSDPHRP
jgi:hypothetical protein